MHTANVKPTMISRLRIRIQLIICFVKLFVPTGDWTRFYLITGEPIVRMMEYVFPQQGFEKITDQFMLGSNILVAPVVNGGNSRKVVLPKGRWIDVMHGKTITGPRSIEVNVPLDELPVYIKK